jgi:hypothetical protein
MNNFFKYYIESLSKTSPIIIYIDMDGVLADLKKGQEDFIEKNFNEIFQNKQDLSSLSNTEKRKILKNIFNKNETLINQEEREKVKSTYWDIFIKQKYFENLNVMSQVKILSKTLKEIKDKYQEVRIEILGSTGNPINHHLVEQQKINWLAKHKDKIDITFDRYNFVAGRKLKQNYASKNTMLIDDTKSNCEEFKNAGGMSFLVKENMNELTDKLEIYINKIKRDQYEK